MRILIVDDDPLICKSLALTLAREPDMLVIGTVGNGAEAIEMCEKTMPDVVLMDIRMPVMDGIQATRIIKKRFARIHVMMLTTFHDRPNIQMALKSGAEGYLLKTDKIASIGEKLRLLPEGTAVLDSEVLKTLAAPRISSNDKLTPREKDVLDLLTQGLTNKEIAGHLFLSEGTVRNVLSVVMEKLNVKNRTQLSLLVERDSDFSR